MGSTVIVTKLTTIQVHDFEGVLGVQGPAIRTEYCEEIMV